MRRDTGFFNTADLDAFDARSAALQDPRPHPTEPQLRQLGQSVMTELLDTLVGSALEDHLAAVCEAVVGGFHAAAQRLEREADRGRDDLARQLRDFDGSEVADVDLEQARRAVEAGDVAVLAVELVRDAAAAAYHAATGEVWSPWRGSVRASLVTAAQIDAQAAVRAVERRRLGAADPGREVVAFRAGPRCDAPEDARRIFDALNWALAQWPAMSLAITGGRGGERLAKRWAQQKRVPLVLATPDFARFGRAAPFRANDQLLALDPVCVLLLPDTLGPAAGGRGFGPVLNLSEQARRRGIRCVRIAAAAGAAPG